MRRKVLAGMLLLSMTASSFSNVSYMNVNAAEMEENVIIATEQVADEAVEDAVTDETAAEVTEEDLTAASELQEEEDLVTVAGGNVDWQWKLNTDTGVLNITNVASGSTNWEWTSNQYRSLVKKVNLTGNASGSLRAMFSGCSNLKEVDLTGLKTDKVTDMSYMFSGTAIETLTFDSGFKTDEVTTMTGMFSGCSNLQKIDFSTFQTQKVLSMSGLFAGCSSLTDVSFGGISTAGVKDMSNMFDGCKSLKSVDVSKFNTSNVSDFSGMFKNCESLASVDVSGFKTDLAEDLSNMFAGCKSLITVDVADFNTAKVQSMYRMFAGCEKLASVDISFFDTDELVTMKEMFLNCKSLKVLDFSKYVFPEELDKLKLNDIAGMFQGCESLVNIDLSKFDVRNLLANGMKDMFTGCRAIQTIKAPALIPANANPTLPVTDSMYWKNEKGEDTIDSMATGEKEVMTYTSIIGGFIPDRGVDTNKWSWNLDRDGMLTIKGNISKVANAESWPWAYYSDDIKSTRINGSAIGSVASMFADCDNLVDVNLAGFDTSQVSDMSNMFKGCKSLASLDFTSCETDKVTTFNNMFTSCISLKSVKFGDKINTTQVQNMAYMFSGCSVVDNIDLSMFNTENVTDMSHMFEHCNALKTVNLNGFNTKKVLDMNQMFTNCSSLETVTLKFETDVLRDVTEMFRGCTALTTLDLSTFDTSNVGIGYYGSMLEDCENLREIKSPKNLNAEVELPTGTKWYDEEDKQVITMYKGRGSSVKYRSDMKVVYGVAFDANGGIGTMAAISGCQVGTPFTLPANTFTRSGYVFTGWNTAADGSGRAIADAATVQDLTTQNNGIVTLYAQWKGASYNLKFNANGGTGTMAAMTNLSAGTNYKLTANSFKRAGYIFTGWNTKKDGTGKRYANKATINLNVSNGKTYTLYAQWKKAAVSTVAKPVLKNTYSRKLTIAFYAASGAKGYVIQYATNSRMIGAKKLYTTSRKVNISAARGKTYYVRVMAYTYDSTKKKVYGKYSPIAYKKISK